jgi:hypothetical protein
MPTLAFVGLIVAIAVLVLIPTRRLFLAGLPSTFLAIYFLAMLALGFVVAELRGPARFLIPILVLAYIAPFITARNGMARLRDRMSGTPPSPPRGPGAGGAADDVRRPPMKNVTPNEARPPDATR